MSVVKPPDLFQGQQVPHKVDADWILAALRRRHDEREWIYLEEFRVGTGYGKYAEKRIDAWAMHYWPSQGMARYSYEVKVTRADFKNELKDPIKRRMALLYSNYYYFVTPADLIEPEELPPEAGLMEVDPNGKCWTVVQAPWRDTPPPSWRFLAAITRRAWEESRARTLDALAKKEAQPM